MQFPPLAAATSSRATRPSSTSPRPESRAVSNPSERILDISLRQTTPPSSPHNRLLSFEGEDDLFGHKTAATLGRKRRESSPKQENLRASPKFTTQSLFRSSRSATPEVAGAQSANMLVADVQMPRSRLIISKTHSLYPPTSTLAPWPSAILGFRVIFHPLSQTRIKDCEIRFNFTPSIGNEKNPSPLIKAIYPSFATASTKDSTEIKRTISKTGGVNLGFDPYGSLHLDASSSMEWSYQTHADIQGSGIETSSALFSLREDPVARDGVEKSLDLAVLLALPSGSDRSFEADMTVEATLSSGSGSTHEALRRFLGSPRVYRITYDGLSEFGELKVGQSLLNP